jgi:cephalosporin hydroxylase
METITEISSKYPTDKSTYMFKDGRNIAHNYCILYDKYFGELRDKQLNILEIGIGETAGSAYLWAEAFQHSKIYIADFDHNKINKFTSQVPSNVSLLYVDQSRKDTLDNLGNSLPELDIIIDDGSHVNDHIILTFNSLFPKLKNGGIYVIEDTYQSYTVGGNSAINFLKDMVDRINDFLSTKKDDYGICSIHFYRNIIFILKGDKITQ